MLRVFILCAQNVLTHDEDITDAYCCVTYEGRDEGPGKGATALTWKSIYKLLAATISSILLYSFCPPVGL